MSIITLTTDFGVGSTYVAEMKGVILSINPDATIVDLTHAIAPQDIREGAVVLESVVDAFPKGTIHVVVVDSENGSDRPMVCAQLGEQIFIAPDNGLLTLLVRRLPPKQIVRLENDDYWRHPVSPTFQGRDIMAPVAAHLSLGVPISELGPPHESVCRIEWPDVVVSEGRIDGIIMKVDSFGNLITNIPGTLLAGRPTDSRACVACDIYETWGIYHTYSEQPRGTFIAMVGSSELLELAIIGESAAERLGIHVGMPVAIGWEHG